LKITIEARLGVTVLLLLAVVASAIGVVYTKHINRKYYAELQKLQLLRDQMNVEWGQWQLERSTFATSSEIERSARERLGMKQPQKNELEVIRP